MRAPDSRGFAAWCSWPHEVLSPEQELALAAAIKRYRPHIRRVARALAAGDVHLYRELDQQGCLKLWQLGAEAIASRTPRHVRNTLSLRLAREFTRASRSTLV